MTSTRLLSRRLLTASVAGVALVATIASGSDESAQKVDAPAGQSDSTASAAESFGVGDHVQIGDWTVIAHGVTDPVQPVNEFMTPAQGNRWVGVDVEVTNGSDTAKSMSSVMCFELLDSTNRSYDVTITGANNNSMDGSVDPGGSLRGTVEFELPQDASGLKLKFACDLMSSNSATIHLS